MEGSMDQIHRLDRNWLTWLRRESAKHIDVVGLQSREKVSNHFIQDLDENEMGPANWNREVLDVTM